MATNNSLNNQSFFVTAAQYFQAQGDITTISGNFAMPITSGAATFVWTNRANAFSGNLINDISYNGSNLFVGVADGGFLNTTPDGITWTNRTSSFSTTPIFGVFYDTTSTWVAVGGTGKLATSPDGVTWTQQTSSFGASNIYCVAWGNGQWVAGGAGGKIATSPDSITWTQQTSAFSGQDVQAVSYNRSTSLWIAVGTDGTINTSPDAVTWTNQTSGTIATLYSVTNNGALWIAVGGAGTVVTSPDGISWSTLVIPLTGNIYVVQYDFTLNIFYCGDSTGNVAISFDGGLSFIENVAPFSSVSVQAFISDGVTIFIAGSGGGITRSSPIPSGSSGIITVDNVNFIHSYGTNNTFVGLTAGNTSTSGTGLNSALGSHALNVVGSGSENTALGANAINHITSGARNIAIGYNAGSALTNGNEGDNILINNVGIAGDARLIRIGTQGSGSGQQDQCFIAGITGVTITPSNLNNVTIDTTTGQLGAQVPSIIFAYTAVPGTPYTVLSTDYYLAVDCSGGPQTLKFPNSPTSYQTWVVKDVKGFAATNNITITSVGGSQTFDGLTSYIMNANYEALTILFDGSRYQIY